MFIVRRHDRCKLWELADPARVNHLALMFSDKSSSLQRSTPILLPRADSRGADKAGH
jgi:hypothetical protein